MNEVSSLEGARIVWRRSVDVALASMCYDNLSGVIINATRGVNRVWALENEAGEGVVRNAARKSPCAVFIRGDGAGVPAQLSAALQPIKRAMQAAPLDTVAAIRSARRSHALSDFKPPLFRQRGRLRASIPSGEQTAAEFSRRRWNARTNSPSLLFN
ncbi:unnamed protein product, partial [Iphiclides podalirius]